MIWPTGLQVLDWFLNVFVTSPILICYWCGIFELYDYYFNYNKDEHLYNSIVITSIGSCFYLAYFIYPLVDRLIRGLHPILRNNLLVTTVMAGGVFHMGYWKGVWMLSELILDGAEWQTDLVFLGGCLLVKVFTTSVNNLLFPPYGCGTDIHPNFLKARDIFGQQVDFFPQFPGFQTKPLIKYILGTAFTFFFVHTFTIFSWAAVLSLVGRLNLDTNGLHWLLAISTIVIFLQFLLEAPLFRLRANFLVNKVSYSFRTSESLKCQQMEISADKSLAQTSTGVAELGLGRMADQKKPSNMALTINRLKQLLFDDLIYLVIFGQEAFFFGPFWDLFVQTFLVDRLFGAWMLTTIGATLVILSSICHLFGGLNFVNDLADLPEKEDLETDNDPTELEADDSSEPYLYPNHYARHFYKYFYGRPMIQISSVWSTFQRLFS